MSVDMKSLAKTLKLTLKLAGYTPETLHQVTGVKLGLLRKYLDGTYLINELHLSHILHACNASVELVTLAIEEAFNDKPGQAMAWEAYKDQRKSWQTKWVWLEKEGHKKPARK